MRNLWILVPIVALHACSTPGSAPAVVQTPILDGMASDQSAVVFVLRDHATSPLQCTGFLIAPDLVLTARHCVAPVSGSSRCDAMGAVANDPFTDATFSVMTDAAPDASSTPLPVMQAMVEPASTGRSMCGNDVALLQLAAPLTNIEPFALRLDEPPVVGESLLVAGYGYGTPGDDSTLYHRLQRTDATVSALGPSTVGGVPRFVEEEFSVDIGPCAGDSGGPALDAEGRAIGVMSRGRQSTCRDMLYGRIDAHAAWLREAVAASYVRAGISDAGRPDAGTSDAATTQDAGRTDMAMPNGGCTIARPMRSSLIAMALCLLALARRRRR